MQEVEVIKARNVLSKQEMFYQSKPVEKPLSVYV